MPSDKKRINLTVPDSVYEELQEYRITNGIMSDASACLQLITQQLKAQKNTELMMKLMRDLSTEQLLALSKEGIDFTKQELGKLNLSKEAQ